MLMVRAPVNPRERNFWQLLSKHRDKIPKETYDYVFYIVSAAVIGENPRLYGFNFDNPLANLSTQASVNGKLQRAVGRHSHRFEPAPKTEINYTTVAFSGSGS